ncbi:MAG: hypothetical protein IJD19_03115 [Ruminococcus sp.]|nr:hypothetical protein [Ruminococcus sp.]
MNKTEAWNLFVKSGSVADYLNYKSAENSVTSQKNFQKEQNENIHRRTDNQTTEYR